MKNKNIAFILLLLLFALVGGYLFFQNSKPPSYHLQGLVGGEKIPLLENEEMVEFLQEEYGLTLNIKKTDPLPW